MQALEPVRACQPPQRNAVIAVDIVAQILLSLAIGLAMSVVLAGFVLLVSSPG